MLEYSYNIQKEENHIMAKTAKAPSGFYTATDVMKKLNIANSTLYHYVETGKIRRVVPPGKKDGYYPKAEIDKMIKARELFVLQYATDTTTFEMATEDDIEGIAELGAELFNGNKTATYQRRITQYHANPEIFYIVKQEELIVGYVGLFPLKQEAIETIMSGMAESRFNVGILSPDNITQFKPGEADSLFLIIGVKQGLKRTRAYGARAVAGTMAVLENLARKGIFTKKLYGTSRTQDGIRLAKGLGFKQVIPKDEEDDLLRFELDLETTTSPFFQKYQRIAKRRKAEEAPVS
jgi:hypothetical protein